TRHHFLLIARTHPDTHGRYPRRTYAQRVAATLDATCPCRRRRTRLTDVDAEHANSRRRTGDRRDRRGRGLRGPLALAGPYTPHGVPVGGRADQRFDELLLAIVD